MKTYSATFRLWDATKGERTAELIDEDGPHKVSPLSAINAFWEKWTAESPVPLDPLQHRTIRVSMSRNNGESVTRRRFEHEGSKYLITIHVSPVAELWECSFDSYDTSPRVRVEVVNGRLFCYLAGCAGEEMRRVEND